MNGGYIDHMMKRRLKDFDSPLLYSPHSFRVTTITDLLEQNVAREDVRKAIAKTGERLSAVELTGTRVRPTWTSRVSRVLKARHLPPPCSPGTRGGNGQLLA